MIIYPTELYTRYVLRTPSIVIGVALALAIATEWTRAASGDIYNLGTLGTSPQDNSRGYSTNKTGQVAGSSFTFVDRTTRAFRYDGIPGDGGVMRDLGSMGGTLFNINGFGSNRVATAFDVNATGQVAGYGYLVDSQITGLQHAFRYDGTPGAGGVMRNLSTLSGGSFSIAVALNDAGQVVGNSDLPGPVTHAFRYDGTPGAGGVMRDLGTFAGTHSEALGINDFGQVVGFASVSENNRYHAFRYDGTPGIDGVMHDLGTLGGPYSTAVSINRSGQIVGYSDVTFISSNYRGFLYEGTPGVDGVMHPLPTFGGLTCYAADINDGGYIVGGASYLPLTGNEVAALWRPDFSIVDLNLWLDTVNPALGAFWTLDDPSGITDDGLITGTGAYNDGPGGLTDGTRAYLLDASTLVPEPEAAAFLPSLISFASLRRKRRAK